MAFESSLIQHNYCHGDNYPDSLSPFHRHNEVGEESNVMTVVDTRELQSLRKQAQRLEQMLQVMPSGVVVLDGDGVVRQANTLAKMLLGEPLEGQRWWKIIERSFNPQADDGHEVSLRDGKKVKLSITPLLNEPGQLIVLTDLTETRQMQQRISHMQRLSALGKTVASLVHQIRTPLSAAMLYASNLTSNKLQESARARFVNKLTDRLGELEQQVNDMLLFAKSGEQQVLQDVSVEDLIDAIKTGAEAMLNSNQVAFYVESETPQLKHSPLKINLSAIQGACLNLIHNAIEVGADHIVLRWHFTRVSGQIMFALSVEDNGPGVKAEDISFIFDPFYTTRSQGTGLGLAVVNAVAQSHKGEVSANNLSEGGARFVMTLPVYQSGGQ
ncbi:HAMP domain-containing histidine kinase [Aestuariibacter sp. AA17]|uniref:histidine kinase n=1 Tax=Fluctibacter corallii TaxID=2984329 RepID=A0ABT3AA07_9ALTE|nr:HAMP domain-containing histidine kinase [Aestuariibacter sp. AA17]MCV2885425.1 HAMP domain-containing histidine kinase [Aestuariibacter sp. AA17]